MARRFLAPSLPPLGGRVTLTPEVSHHLLVVNLTPRGEALVLFDGQGQECDAQLVDVSEGCAVAQSTSAPRRVQEQLPIVLIAALTRKPAWELALRMATELGATEIRPFIGKRSVAQGEHRPRWEKILEGAARQSGRTSWPALTELAPLGAQLQLPDGLRRLVLAPDAPTRPLTAQSGVALLIGPEGGLTPKELALAQGANFEPAGLGPWTLRADTAVAAALSRYRPQGS